ncbi:MAG: hypothetical protein EOO50_10700 [Flavobacterium sp.]|uniref:hypothetical protein n=1 Tax=Flavobacterium sp. TaxID=239 RepID=UPI00121C09A5|nr:hypothetical protein [Flavobacterium sp.]RZJ66253.1 MAG: hypothetical protein EOO50_10700 [Flavobacterium sp.]
MKKIIFAFVATAIGMSNMKAQNPTEVKPATVDSADVKWQQREKTLALQDLDEEKKRIEDSEKFRLKRELEAINKRLSEQKITSEEAKRLKEDAAKNAAISIDTKLAIVENQKKLVERGDFWTFRHERGSQVELGLGNVYDDRGSFLVGLNYVDKRKSVQYDKRTYADIVLAGGISNTVSDEHSLKDSPYKIWKSGFSEFGVTLRTRLLKDSNFLRLAYGTSLHVHSFELTGNRAFAVNGDETTFETFAQDLKYQKLRVTNLVFPVYLEFGNSKKLESYDRVRYSTVDNWKFGLGGYAGMNLWQNQKLRYYEDHRKIEDTQRRSFNATNFVYGLGAYVGYGPISIYAKYDLNPLFKNGPTRDNVFSLALRIDL